MATKNTRAIKGTNLDLTCRGFHFAVGETFNHEGAVVACGSGFHACPEDEHPLSVFGYYAPAASRYFDVTVGGKTHREGNKIAGGTITIDAEITIGDLVKRAFDWVWARAIKTDEAHSTGYQGAASSTGNQGAASSTGKYGAASSTGNYGAASSTGDCGAAMASGRFSV